MAFPFVGGYQNQGETGYERSDGSRHPLWISRSLSSGLWSQRLITVGFGFAPNLLTSTAVAVERSRA
jgi:hypothetical protein